MRSTAADCWKPDRWRAGGRSGAPWRGIALCVGLVAGCTGDIGQSGDGGASADADPLAPDAEPAGAVDAAPCPDLAARITVTAVAVAPAQVQVGSASGFSSNRPVILSPLADGTARVAWTDSSQLHITPLTATDQRAGADLTLAGDEVRGFVAHTDGSAVLVRRGDRMSLHRVDAAGGTVFEIDLVGGNAHDQIGDKWIDSWTHEGRLAWSGSDYAVYFGHTQLWDSGNHQGDYLGTVGTSGGLSVQWAWGCSHSLDVRLARGTTGWGPVCLSDCYPGKGIYFNHNFKITDEPTGNCSGGSAASLGGLVPVADGYGLTFASPEGRASTDIGLVHIDPGGTPGTVHYLTDTAGVDEHGAKLAAYGPGRFLAGWLAGDQATLAVVDADGTVLEGPVAITAQFADRDDFVNLSNGDVGWAYAWGNYGELKVVRVRQCP